MTKTTNTQSEHENIVKPQKTKHSKTKQMSIN